MKLLSSNAQHFICQYFSHDIDAGHVPQKSKTNHEDIDYGFLDEIPRFLVEQFILLKFRRSNYYCIGFNSVHVVVRVVNSVDCNLLIRPNFRAGGLIRARGASKVRQIRQHSLLRSTEMTDLQVLSKQKLV